MARTPKKKVAAPDRSEEILTIDEESSGGGCSYCWVERRDDGYYLFGTELGKMCGPRKTVHEALGGSGFQFGMDYMKIETALSMAKLKSTMRKSGAFILSNVSHLTIDGDKVDPMEFMDSAD
jgi:hypothetical protein